MTAASKLLGVVMMPLCLYLYARPFSSADMPIPYADIVKTLVVLLLPVALAMYLRSRWGERFARGAEKVGSISGLTLLVAIAGITALRNAHLFATISAPMYLAAITLGASGMLFGALVSGAFGLSSAARRTVSFETGVQNSPLCFAILALAFPSQGELSILRLPLLYSLFVLIEASLATAVYRALDGRREAPAAASSAAAS
jgi:predicted Na+-dependent transporter